MLSRKDIQITQTGGREVVYDTRTGEPAKIWTVEKTDGTAKTFENEREAEKSMEKGDELKSKEITPEDVKQRADDNLPTAHFEDLQPDRVQSPGVRALRLGAGGQRVP